MPITPSGTALGEGLVPSRHQTHLQCKTEERKQTHTKSTGTIFTTNSQHSSGSSASSRRGRGLGCGASSGFGGRGGTCRSGRGSGSICCEVGGKHGGVHLAADEGLAELLASEIIGMSVDALVLPLVTLKRWEGLGEVGDVGISAFETLAAVSQGFL